MSFSILKRKNENNIDTYSSLHPRGIARADYHCRCLYNRIQTGLFWPSLALRNSRTIRATDYKSRVLFLVKGPFRQIFLGEWGRGGWLCSWSLYTDEYLHFENAIFCSSNCNVLRILLTTCLYYSFLYFFRSSVLHTVNINYRTHTVQLIKYLPPKFITTGGLFSEGLIH